VLVADPILLVVLVEADHDLRKQARPGEADACFSFHQRPQMKDNLPLGWTTLHDDNMAEAETQSGLIRTPVAKKSKLRTFLVGDPKSIDLRSMPSHGQQSPPRLTVGQTLTLSWG
jgi:hypothetical protein